MENLFNWSNVDFAPKKFTIPSVNIQELDDKFLIELAAPGLKKEDFQIELTDNVLTIKSESKNENEISDDNFHRREFSYQSFQRSFNFASDLVDETMIVEK